MSLLIISPVLSLWLNFQLLAHCIILLPKSHTRTWFIFLFSCFLSIIMSLEKFRLRKMLLVGTQLLLSTVIQEEVVLPHLDTKYMNIKINQQALKVPASPNLWLTPLLFLYRPLSDLLWLCDLVLPVHKAN